MTPSRNDDGIAVLTAPRRAILGLLAIERTAGEIAEHFQQSRPAISSHLKALLDAKLVSYRRHGTRRWYVADRGALERLFLDTWEEVAP